MTMTMDFSKNGRFLTGGTITRTTRGLADGNFGEDVFGYVAPPGTITAHRDVLRWVQSLDLAHSLKDCRRDVANGFYVAQIFSRFFPDQVRMHSFENGHSTATKKDNWAQIQRFCEKWQGAPLPEDLVSDTIAGVHGAAVLLLQYLYTLFTGKQVQQRPPTPPPEENDLEEEKPKRRTVAAPVIKKGRAKEAEAGHDDGKPKNYALVGSRPVGTRAASAKSVVEFGTAGKIQLGEVSDVQELRRKLQGA